MNPEQLQRRVEASGVTYWELAKLLGVHAHQVNGLSPTALSRLPARLLLALALAERLDLDPAELISGLGARRSADLPQDAEQVANALAHAPGPFTAWRLAQVFGWTLERVEQALEQVRARPEVTGPFALRFIPGEGYVLEPRLDRLDHDQIAALRRAETDLAAGTVRQLQLLHQAHEQGVDPSEVPAALVEQELVVIGADGRARLHEDVALALEPE
ncbi:hypothetical protein [Nocardiopsis alba]|uniref:hypothetical protein n=1 Tax=Nocardiopsis alba TaxID=53437 RepID=UPI0033A3A598